MSSSIDNRDEQPAVGPSVATANTHFVHADPSTDPSTSSLPRIPDVIVMQAEETSPGAPQAELALDASANPDVVPRNGNPERSRPAGNVDASEVFPIQRPPQAASTLRSHGRPLTGMETFVPLGAEIDMSEGIQRSRRPERPDTNGRQSFHNRSASHISTARLSRSMPVCKQIASPMYSACVLLT